MRTIRFTQDYVVKGEGGPKYKAGQVVELPVSSCEHFISRRVAEYETEGLAPTVPADAPRRGRRPTAGTNDDT